MGQNETGQFTYESIHFCLLLCVIAICRCVVINIYGTVYNQHRAAAIIILCHFMLHLFYSMYISVLKECFNVVKVSIALFLPWICAPLLKIFILDKSLLWIFISI